MIFINFGYPMGTANENLLFHRLTPLLPPPSGAAFLFCSMYAMSPIIFSISKKKEYGSL